MRSGLGERMWTKVAIGAVTVALVAGCGSSKSTSGGPSATTAGGGTSPATTATGSASSGSASGQAAAVKAVIAPYLQTPTKINQTVPLTGKIPTTKPWVVITCELPQCKEISDGALAAAKAAGVPAKLLSYMTTDGTTLTTAMKQALTYKPFAVSPIGFTQATWNTLQPQYKAAGVIITPLDVGDTTPSSVVTQGSGSQLDFAKAGKLLADYVTADSNGSAHVLVQDVPAFAVLKAFADGFRQEIPKVCPQCKVTSLNATPAELASSGVVSAVVAALQKDSSIKYLVSTDGALLVGLTTSLKAAGISGMKILGGSPSINNLTDLKTGGSTAWAASAEDQYGWVALDIIGRTVLHMNVAPADGGAVVEILTKANVGTPSPTGLGAPVGYQKQFEKLWGVG